MESGEFELLVGRSSREIVLRDIVKVRSTQEIVPTFHRNTTLGELMANPKTAPILQQLQQMKLNVGPSEAVSSDMLAAMLRYMPVRTLMPFSHGTITEEGLSELLDKLNQAVVSSQSHNS
ncbi:Thermostable beta-glucosidase B [compost metagenome]